MNYRNCFASLLLAAVCATASAQDLKFAFPDNGKADKSYQTVTKETRFDTAGYGYDILPSPSKGGKKPFYFSVKVPDGNYRVTVTLGSKRHAGVTTVRAESRRLFLNAIKTKKGEYKTYSFIVNMRTPEIDAKSKVRLKPREVNKLNWDHKLTLEFNGESPAVQSIRIEKDDKIPTVFLCGNSTVTDQESEPWASWGQMIPYFFNDKVAIANYAESGETASGFISLKRLAKLLTQVKKGDYILVEFGHNDQKIKSPGAGAYYLYSYSLKTFVDEARRHGATPIFVTPTQRRFFDEQGKIRETHGDFPAAMEAVAKREKVGVIDVHQMSRTLFESLGVEGSKQALVHYPANTFPGQTKALADNTHFNPYGAFEIAKCVVEGMKKLNLPIVKDLNSNYKTFDPAHPDNPKLFHWDLAVSADLVKPEGN